MQHGQAKTHKHTIGDAQMAGSKKKSYSLHFVLVEDRGAEIAKDLARQELNKVFAKHGVVCDNLDEILSKYITGVMRDE